MPLKEAEVMQEKPVTLQDLSIISSHKISALAMRMMVTEMKEETKTARQDLINDLKVIGPLVTKKKHSVKYC